MTFKARERFDDYSGPAKTERKIRFKKFSNFGKRSNLTYLLFKFKTSPYSPCSYQFYLRQTGREKSFNFS